MGQDKSRGPGVLTLAAFAAAGWWLIGGDMPADLPRPGTVLASLDLPSLLPDSDRPRENRSGGGRCSVEPMHGYDETQMGHALTITQVGVDMGMPDRAVVVALAAAMQESSLTNHGHLGDRNDHDSQGLFQQRPSQGWGTPAQVTDPEYAARKFYQALKRVDGWEDMRVTEAAQRVQRSAYPEAYQKHVGKAKDLAGALLPCTGR